jgi:hypothetical protein
MSAEENKAIARRHFEELWEKGDVSVADEIYAADAVGHDPMNPGHADYPESEKQAIIRDNTAFPNPQVTIEDQIAEGDKVVTWYISANFDESAFEDPHRFDIGRTPNRHMAFGPGGIHHCMGAHLAKMEIRITFEELLKRSADIELLGPPERLRSNFFNGIKRLPVRVTQ